MASSTVTLVTIALPLNFSAVMNLHGLHMVAMFRTSFSLIPVIRAACMLIDTGTNMGRHVEDIWVASSGTVLVLQVGHCAPLGRQSKYL